MEFIIKATSSNTYYYSSYDNSSNNEEIVALVSGNAIDPAALAKVCINVDELNILVNMFSRDNLKAIISLFGSQIDLEQMRLVAICEDLPSSAFNNVLHLLGDKVTSEICNLIAKYGEQTPADLEEYVLSVEYAEWVTNRYNNARNKANKENFDRIKQYIIDYGDFYTAMKVIAKEQFLEPISRSELYTAFGKQKDSIPTSISRYYSAEELNLICKVRTLEQLFMLYGGSFASEKSLAEEARWANDARLMGIQMPEEDEEDWDAEEHTSYRQITISPFCMPRSGVLVIANNNSSHYYND